MTPFIWLFDNVIYRWCDGFVLLLGDLLMIISFIGVDVFCQLIVAIFSALLDND